MFLIRCCCPFAADGLWADPLSAEVRPTLPPLPSASLSREMQPHLARRRSSFDAARRVLAMDDVEPSPADKPRLRDEQPADTGLGECRTGGCEAMLNAL